MQMEIALQSENKQTAKGTTVPVHQLAEFCPRSELAM
jgi:hypothetical protein